MNVLVEKFREVLYSILPITVIVLVLNFTIAHMSGILIGRFLIGVLFIILGLTVFLFGIDIGITPLGNHIGSQVSKYNRIRIIVAVGLILGFFISIAEPDLQVLASQVSSVTMGSISKLGILVAVSVGIAVMLVLGLIRIVYNLPLFKVLTVIMGIILILSFFVSPEFLAISFDASGATTGALTVPFILAMATGVSGLKKDSIASETDSFGLVAISSTGAILGVMVMGIFSKITGLSGSIEHSVSKSDSLTEPFISNMPVIIFESFLALLPLVVIFIVFQIKAFKFTGKRVKRLLKGLLYTFIGLILFLTGVNTGFMDVGTVLGQIMGSFESKSIVVIVGFLLGLVTIMAEPAVHVLIQQIEMVTSGYIRKSMVLGALAIGVGSAVALSILRIIIPEIQLWHYLLPGYIISVAMSYFTPKLFVGIAFDSGGVASGTMVATFILAFAQGVADSVSGADILKDAFGMIALVAMTPIITLQILGLIVRLKSRKVSKKGDVDSYAKL